MYKDVWKRILAMAVAVCMIGTSIQWPETVMAAGVKQYHNYQHGSGSASYNDGRNYAAAVFTINQNSSGGAEILDKVSFPVAFDKNATLASATISYYVAQDGELDSKDHIHSNTYTSDGEGELQLKDGENEFDAKMGSRELAAGTKIAVVVSLQGANLAYCATDGAGQTFINENNSWKDANEYGKAAVIRAHTYNVGDDGADGDLEIENQLLSSLSLDDDDTDNTTVTLNGNERLNKTNLVIPLGKGADIVLNNVSNESAVSWSIEDESYATIQSSGSTVSIMASSEKVGTTNIIATYGGKEFKCSLMVTNSVEYAQMQMLNAAGGVVTEVVYNGKTQVPGLKVTMAEGDITLVQGTDYSIKYYRVDGDSATEIAPSDIKDAGVYSVKITGQGNYVESKSVTYTILPKPLTDETIQISLGTWTPATPATYIASVVDSERETALTNGNDQDTTGDYYLTYEYNSSNEVTAINVIGRNNYQGTQTYVTPVSLTNAQIKIEEGTFVYLGEEWQPKFSVSITTDSGAVVIPVDGYTTEYKNNVEVSTETSKATITITGQNGYYGTASAEFTIVPKDISNADHLYVSVPVEVTVANIAQTEEPKLTVTYNGKTLEKGTDYSIASYTNGDTKGTCVIEGIGNFTGTRADITYGVKTKQLSAVVAGIRIDDVTYTGTAQTPAIIFTDANGNEIEDCELTSDDYDIIYTNNINVGTAEVVVQGKGDYAGQLEGFFVINPADINSSSFGYTMKDASGNTKEYDSTYAVGYSRVLEEMMPGVTVTHKYTGGSNVLTAGTDYSVEYSLQTENFTADTDFSSTKLKVTITAKNGNYNGTKVLEYSVTPCELERAEEKGLVTVKLNKTNFNYTGEVQEPTLTVTYTNGTEVYTLKDGTDYTYSYTPTTPKEIGTYTISIDGKKNFTGSVYATFSINMIDITSSVKIEVDKTNGSHVDDYNGLYPMMWFDDSGFAEFIEKDTNKLKLNISNSKSGVKLVEGTDYELTYTNIKDVSKTGALATVTVTGKGAYTGSFDVYYLLAGKLEEYTLNLKDEGLVYTGDKLTLQDDSISVYQGWIVRDTLDLNADYRVRYENNLDAGDATVYVEALADTELPTANGCYRYSSDATELSNTFKISPKDIREEDVTLSSVCVKPFTGSAVTLDPEDIQLVYNGNPLTEADFTIDVGSYGNNTSATDSAYVYIEGKDNYAERRKITFSIQGKNFDDVVADIDEVTYTGDLLYPTINLLKTADGDVISEDYYSIVGYEDNQNAGTGYILIQGAGDYLNSEGRIPFTIKPRDLSITDNAYGKLTVSGMKSPYTYTSQAITPKVELKYQATDATDISDCSKQNLVQNTDFAVSYKDNTDATNSTVKAAVVITGKGNYTGEVKKEFEIAQKSIADDDLLVATIPAQPVKVGFEAVTPIPEITYQYGTGETEVYHLSADDYTLEYANNRNVGTATITIKGDGNFTGEKVVEFQIGNPITDTSKVSITCEADGTEVVYNGSAYTPKVVVTNLTTGSELEECVEYTEDGNNVGDYVVEYTDNCNVGTATITVRGINDYAGEKTFTFDIVPRSLDDAQLAVEGVTDGTYKTAYTRNPIKPKVTVLYNGKEEKGFSVNYGADNTSVGTVIVTVTAGADSNFTGSKTTKFTITKAKIGTGGLSPASGFTMDVVEPQPLGSNGATPTPKLYHNGEVMTAGVDYIYTYKNNDAIGTNAVVTLTGQGNYEGSINHSFEIRGNIADTTIEIPESVKYTAYLQDNGDGTFSAPDKIELEDDELVVKAGNQTLTKGTHYTVSYENNTWVGVANVIIKGIGSYAGSVTKNVKITADLTDEAMEFDIGEQKYTGEEICPIPIITYYGKTLTESEHFFLDWDDNTNISDEAKVTIIGNTNNGFFGEITKTFRITANAELLEISGVEKSYQFRGEQIKPTVVVKAGSKTLENGTDYELSYGSNRNVATGGYVYVKGINDYAGFTQVATFQIEPLDMSSLTVLDGESNTFAAREYTGKAILPKVALTAKIGTQTYTLEENDGDYTVTVDGDNVSVGTVTLVIAGTADSNGKQNITGTREVTFEITKKSLSKPASGAADTISVEVRPDKFAYDGTEKTPSVIVTYQYGTESEVRTLEQDKDYTVSYSDNIAAGTATVTVSGKGNYAGSRTATFTITARDMSTATIKFPNGKVYPYMGHTVGVEPEVTIELDGVTLTKDTDYTVSYDNNKACGTASVTVTGKGDFSGSVTDTFTIESHSLEAADIVVADIPNQAYTGSPVVPELTITCGEYQLVKGIDYTLTCEANTEIGKAAVIIEGVGGFTGTRRTTFMIASSIAKAEISGLKDSYPYTGQPLTEEQLGITEVTIGDATLSPSDYEVSFAEGSDGKSAGKQVVVLTGTGNYGGTKECEITITPKNITDEDVVLTGFETVLPYTPALIQNITLTWGTITLQDETDYEVDIAATETKGIYRMTVIGKGNYTGKIERKFTVEMPAIDSIEIKGVSSNYTYMGEAIEPKPTIKLGDSELKEGTDYTLAYSENVNVGVATMRIIGTGTYFTGEKEVSFTILRRSINHGTFSEIPTQVYTGKDIKPAVSVENSGKTLVEKTDYTLMYKNNRKTGTASVVVAGKGNFTSTKTIPFAIRPCNVETATVTGASGTTVSLSWKGEGVVTGYEIYRATADGKWQLVGGTKGTTYTDAKLSAGTSYSYKVRSYVVEENETYYGAFSTVVNAVTTK